jgi:hypothetical protein
VTPWKGRRRKLAAAIGVLLVAVALVAGLTVRRAAPTLPPRPAAERPDLLLLTSLPIVFPDEMTLQIRRSPALAALQARYRVMPVSTADWRSLAGHRLLLMAQPRAQPGEILVELDQWVRDGGHVLVLADPALEWPSSRPLGDPLRPSMAFADTGLLMHWGVRLDAPEEPGPEEIAAGPATVRTVAPGTLVAIGGGCAVGNSGLVAHCRIGKGEATVIADADFLGDSPSLGLLMGELDRLEQ